MKRFGAQKAYLVCMVIMSVFISILSGCGGGGGGVWNKPVASSVTVTSSVPANGETGVYINRKITATFSGAMDPATITPATFTLKQGTTAVPGTVTYSGVTAVFKPDSNLLINTKYTATITTGAFDLAGKALAANYSWSFTTGLTADTTAPTLITTGAFDGETGLPINRNSTATFSEPMDSGTLNSPATSFTVKEFVSGNPVAGVVTYINNTATFNPNSNLLPNTKYISTITTGAKDLSGNALVSGPRANPWSWTTGATADTTPPTVTLTDPANLATGVALSKRVSATFSEAMDPLTITNVTFTVTGPGVTPVTGTVAYVGLVATFTPTSPLAPNTTYTARITTEAKDLADNALASDKVWSFTTVTAVAAGPLPVDLGTAGNYVILAKSAVSTTGTTAVVGDIGLSPAAASFITGFSLIADSTNTFSTSSLVTGKVYAADYAPPTPANITAAVSDMETAFTDAAGRTLPDFTELGAGNISGMTLVPGLYKWGTGVLITASGVTLSGGANDVWIFQIAQDLTVNNSAIVTLSGGAQAKNIFWQVAGQATLGTAADFKGIILSQTLISMDTGAKMKGRALAQTAVTLNATDITAP